MVSVTLTGQSLTAEIVPSIELARFWLIC
jgi:hypothetical protein